MYIYVYFLLKQCCLYEAAKLLENYVLLAFAVSLGWSILPRALILFGQCK